MNILHLKYMIEIERVGSISQAAKNLYVGQPNLSRILKEVEDTVGFAIFDRTYQGIRPTERGTVFMKHAHNILREMEAIENMVSGNEDDNCLRVCIPRATAAFDIVSDYLLPIAQKEGINAIIRECHPQKALDLLSNGHMQIAVIRFREDYRQYFNEQATLANLKFQELCQYEDVVLIDETHPLADRTIISREELTDYLQITHSDRYLLPNPKEKVSDSRIHTVDRLAQLSLLKKFPGSYTWSAPVPDKYLKKWGLVQLSCKNNLNKYSEAVVHNSIHLLSDMEKHFLKVLKKQYTLA